jgi:hypothetical protein
MRNRVREAWPRVEVFDDREGPKHIERYGLGDFVEKQDTKMAVQ